MTTNTYSEFSEFCVRFYDLVVEANVVADFVLSKLGDCRGKSVLFVGGFFQVAKQLHARGLELTVVDYTDEMVSLGRQQLEGIRVEKADLAALEYLEEFDVVIVIGRVFTHLLSAEAAHSALAGVYRALKPKGLALIDNYESSKIEKTDYFNGRVRVEDQQLLIIRDSSTKRISTTPHVVEWSARYHVTEGGQEVVFSDTMPQRAFSREEMDALCKAHGFGVCQQGDNFDETSFYTLMQQQPHALKS